VILTPLNYGAKCRTWKVPEGYDSSFSPSIKVEHFIGQYGYGVPRTLQGTMGRTYPALGSTKAQGFLALRVNGQGHEPVNQRELSHSENIQLVKQHG
jgi:hypothetical protein